MGNKKIKYEKPVIEIITIETEDIIVTSGGDSYNPDYGEGGGED